MSPSSEALISGVKECDKKVVAVAAAADHAVLEAVAAARSQGSLQKAPGTLLRAGTEGEPRLHECDGGVEARISEKAPRQLPQPAGSLVGTVPDNQTADAFEPRPYESRRIAAVQKRFAARS